MVRTSCWSCRGRQALPGFAVHVRLRKDLANVWFVVGMYERYQKAVVRVPMCRSCGSEWHRERVASNVFTWVAGCSGSLIMLLFIIGVITAIAIGAYYAWLFAAVLAVPAALIAGLAKWYQNRHPPGKQRLRHPHSYPKVTDLVANGFVIQN
jgi:hypothetical protein